MREYSFFDSTTGLFVGRTFSLDDADERRHAEYLERHTPEGCKAIEGIHDHLSKRVDLETKEVIDYQPPQPSPEHEWSETKQRWQLSTGAADRERARTAAMARIAQLEREVQPQLLRAVALEQSGAKEKLQALDAEIASLRASAQ